jgi:hypothetical protein
MEGVRPLLSGKPQRMAGADFITAILLILFGVAFFAGAMNMRIYQTFFISPGFFPAILGILFVTFGGILLYASSKRGGRADALRIVSGENLKGSFTSPVFKKGGVVFLLILIYVSLLGIVDFVALTAGYLFLTFFFLRAGKLAHIAAIAVVTPFIVRFVFKNLFKIPMP